MTSERIPSQSDRNVFFTSRPAELIRATAVRVALLATFFGFTANAIAGDHDKATAPTTPSNLTPATLTKASPTARIKHWFETGQASWYGLKFQGHKTATGEKFDMNTFTCAHRSLPLGSWLRVTNLRNRKSVLVRVNDRGPMVDDRIVDLSYAAAHAVGIGGVAKVKLERVNLTDPGVARILLAQMPPLPFGQLAPAH
jgi:rare lipoprotein A